MIWQSHPAGWSQLLGFFVSVLVTSHGRWFAFVKSKSAIFMRVSCLEGCHRPWAIENFTRLRCRDVETNQSLKNKWFLSKNNSTLTSQLNRKCFGTIVSVNVESCGEFNKWTAAQFGDLKCKILTVLFERKKYLSLVSISAKNVDFSVDESVLCVFCIVIARRADLRRHFCWAISACQITRTQILQNNENRNFALKFNKNK